MDPALQSFLSPYTPEVRDLFLKARHLVQQAVPEAVEQVDAPSKLVAYGLGTRYADTIFTLMPLKAGLNLGLYRAVDLPDPEGLLSGTGKLHRHVRVNSPEELDSPALSTLLEAAVTAARLRKR